MYWVLHRSMVTINLYGGTLNSIAEGRIFLSPEMPIRCPLPAASSCSIDIGSAFYTRKRARLQYRLTDRNPCSYG